MFELKIIYQPSKVYLGFCAIKARDGITSLVVWWQMLKITWCIIQLLNLTWARLTNYGINLDITVQVFLLSKMKASWQLVCFLTNCNVLFPSFKSIILNMFSFFCYFLPTLLGNQSFSVRSTLTRCLKVEQEFWNATTLLPVNNRDAWVLRTPVFWFEFVSPGIYRSIFTRDFLAWLELWNGTFHYL